MPKNTEKSDDIPSPRQDPASCRGDTWLYEQIAEGPRGLLAPNASASETSIDKMDRRPNADMELYVPQPSLATHESRTTSSGLKEVRPATSE